MLQRWKEWLALTDAERKVLIFLSVTMMAGLGIKFYRATFPEQKVFDYTASDSTFAALSIEELEHREEDDTAPGKRLNINTATKSQLMGLPGIGEVTAERILVYREEVGTIKNLEELTRIKGISKNKLNQLKKHITVH
jgi:competence protein ComEA